MDNAEKKWFEFLEKCAGFCSKMLDRMDALPKALEQAIDRDLAAAEKIAERTEGRNQANHDLDILKTKVNMIRLQQSLEIDQLQHAIQVKRLRAELENEQIAPKFGDQSQK